ncbi:hypothetical protein M9H77_13217 [Catharanthus roseus]|uniref:Uncharacterized protein n=1 Tax=Catharanthus roseus TaxID=4058 RepID=A0ACC0BJQ9_CATRO|nr:hypothetical protein M9H77_13217 [Catharanthus roseus]
MAGLPLPLPVGFCRGELGDRLPTAHGRSDPTVTGRFGEELGLTALLDGILFSIGVWNCKILNRGTSRGGDLGKDLGFIKQKRIHTKVVSEKPPIEGQIELFKTINNGSKQEGYRSKLIRDMHSFHYDGGYRFNAYGGNNHGNGDFTSRRHV